MSATAEPRYDWRVNDKRWRRVVFADWWHKTCHCRCFRWYSRRCGPCWCGR